jgi:hypothetical protein
VACLGTETVDRTGPVVLKALDDLHEYQAATAGLAARAEENTRRMLEKMLGALGFTHVEVDFASPPAG